MLENDIYLSYGVTRPHIEDIEDLTLQCGNKT